MVLKLTEVRILLLILASTLVLVIGTVVFQRVRRSNSVKNTAPPTTIGTDAAVPLDWRRVEIHESVVFYIPSSLRSEGDVQASGYIPPGLSSKADDQVSGYRGFRNETMEVLMDYGLFNHVTTCVVQDDERRHQRVRLSDTRIDGREARIEKIDRMPFNLDDDAKLAGSGFAICVPDVGDHAHEFAIVGKYKREQDYQTLLRILDSIRFRTNRS